jgi:hypothetical protein
VSASSGSLLIASGGMSWPRRFTLIRLNSDRDAARAPGVTVARCAAGNRKHRTSEGEVAVHRAGDWRVDADHNPSAARRERARGRPRDLHGSADRAMRCPILLSFISHVISRVDEATTDRLRDVVQILRTAC